MAKSARASSRKANNQRLKQNVFGPVESARTERLAAKLQALVEQQLPKKEEEDAEAKKDEAAMDVETTETTEDKTVKPKKRGIEKRRKKASINSLSFKQRMSSRRRKR